MSAFTSIKEVSRDLLGWAGFISSVVDDRFRNINHLAEAKCPCFIMHGLKDTLINPKHSMDLKQVAPKGSYLHLVANMDHNEF